jgi:predicted RNA binding protein YcfA (HicA-like mRNA interferase family)
MSVWKSVKAKQLLAALLRIGWYIAWQRGSHRRLKRPGWPNYTFAFHDNETVGPALKAEAGTNTPLR